MKRVLLPVCVAYVLALLALPVQAQEWSPEQLEVWQTITKQWDMEKTGDHTWVDELHDSFVGWPSDSQVPHNKQDVARFVAIDSNGSKIVLQHQQPLAIVVSEDTAVVHYFYTTIIDYDDGDRETVDGRATDVLVRTGDRWQILSWVTDEEDDAHED